jgi:menaquinol-cytochrome c reductase iron-sulfur subunit
MRRSQGRNRPRTTAEARIPGAFDGETVTRRRLLTSGANAAGAVAAAAIGLPALGFAIGPVFERTHWSWQSVGAPGDFPDTTYVPKVIVIDRDVGEAGRSTVFVRKRNPTIDRDRADEWNRFVAISSRCAHVGCPVNYVDAAGSFICPCHGGVYDFRGIRIGGPPPRPLDRFFTRVSAGQVQIGPRYSVNDQLQRFSPRDPGEPLDGIGQYLYPARPTTGKFPKR